jgi:N-glycosidase YbiA
LAIRFYKVNDNYGCFSNFSKHGFDLDGKYWPTSEHYFQAQKFVGSIFEEEIRQAKSPNSAAKLGRDRSKPLRPDWELVKDEIMKKAILQKFQTNIAIRDILISTSTKEIIEETTDDYYWGCGSDGTGKNVLGKILMEIRSMLETEYT